MAGGVPGRVDGPQRPARQVEQRAVGKPAVAGRPTRAWAGGRRAGDPGCRGPSRPAPPRPSAASMSMNPTSARPAATSLIASMLARSASPSAIWPRSVVRSSHRERVVVLVDVGDEEVPDVGQAVAELAKRPGQPLAGLRERHARVDQVHAVVAGDGVDVHRGQRVARQRQRYPVQARRRGPPRPAPPRPAGHLSTPAPGSSRSPRTYLLPVQCTGRVKIRLERSLPGDLAAVRVHRAARRHRAGAAARRSPAPGTPGLPCPRRPRRRACRAQPGSWSSDSGGWRCTRALAVRPALPTWTSSAPPGSVTPNCSNAPSRTASW